MPKYRKRLNILYPDCTQAELEEILELRINFWKGLVENFDLFYN